MLSGSGPRRRVRAARLAALAAVAALACGRDLESPDPAVRARAVRALGGADAPLAPLLVAERDGSALVRRAAAEAFASRGGPDAADALAKLVRDPSPDVAAAAAAGLSGMPSEPRARQGLVQAYAEATPRGRAGIADALEHIGVSLREAVDAESRALWERNLSILEHGSGAARAGAAEEIGASARTDAVQRLVPLVDTNRNRDRLLAAAAARGLGESGEWTARPFLEALLADKDALLAEAAAAALGRLGDPSAADALAEAAGGDAGGVASAAGEALAALPEAPQVGVALCELALRSADPGLAGRSAREVRRREGDGPVRPILARLGRPGAHAALAALAELPLPRDAAASAAEKVAPLLDPSRAPDPEIRAAAARALGRLGGALAAPALLRRAQALAAQLSEKRARWVTATAAPAAPPERVDAVAAGDARELGALLAALGRVHAEGGLPLLAALARDPLPAVRAGAVEGLAEGAGAQGFEAASAALGDPDAAVRMAGLEGLPRFGARSVPALARAAEAGAGASAAWRSALARALGDTGSPEAIPALTALLEGTSAGAAAAALARLGAPAAVAPLVAHVGKAGAPARAEAIEALAQLAARDAAPAIAQLLTDERPEVRAAAARALGRLRHQPAAARLESLRSDYYGRVRRAAVEALSKL